MSGVVSYSKKIDLETGEYMRTNFYEKYKYLEILEENIMSYRKEIEDLGYKAGIESLWGESYFEDGSYAIDMKIQKEKYLKELLIERSAIIIGRSWKKCRYDPKFRMCHIVQIRMMENDGYDFSD